MAVGSLITFILVLAIVGAIVYVVITYVPMPPLLRTVIIVVAAIAILLWLLSAVTGQRFGL